METEQIEAFITRLRAGIDGLTDKLLDELGEVREMLINGNTSGALEKLTVMIESVEELEDEDSD